MREQAETNSGVKQEEAQDISDLYGKIGEPAFRKLSVLFYDKGLRPSTHIPPKYPPSPRVQRRPARTVPCMGTALADRMLPSINSLHVAAASSLTATLLSTACSASFVLPPPQFASDPGLAQCTTTRTGSRKYSRERTRKARSRTSASSSCSAWEGPASTPTARVTRPSSADTRGGGSTRRPPSAGFST